MNGTKKKAAVKRVMFADVCAKGLSQTPKKRRKRNRNDYPDCTKEALLRAYENANLPDFDAIAKHPLIITKIKMSEVDAPPKKPSPTVHKLLEPFYDLIDWSKVDLNIENPIVSPAKLSQQSVHEMQKTINEVSEETQNTVIVNENVLDSPRVALRSIGNKVSVPKKFSKLSVNYTDNSVITGGVVTSTPIQTFRRNQISEKLSPISLTNIDLSQESSGSESFKSWNIVNRKGSSLFKPRSVKNLRSTSSPMQGSFSFCVERLGSCRDMNANDLRCIETSKQNNLSSFSSEKNCNYNYRKSIAYKRNFGLSASFNHLTRVSSYLPKQISVLAEGLNTREDLRKLVNSSFAAAFSTSKVVFCDGEEETITTKEKVLLLCKPSQVISFRSLLTCTKLTSCKKIGEGSYGEVFDCKKCDGSSVVIKVVALEMNELYEEDIYAQILPELMISNSLSAIRVGKNNQAFNFINMMHASCVKGRFPNILLREWQRYKEQFGSENENPSKFGSDQLYAVMFLANGGQDLESYQFNSAVEALSVFQQISCSLAAAECEYEFEHRDLHWGNALVISTNDRDFTFVINGNNITVNTSGVLVSIIDFSLSRMCKDGVIVFNDLGKYTDVFEGKGDYQFDIYRNMRDENGNDWERFSPRTNILWLHYMLHKLVECKKYRTKSQAHTKAFNTLKNIMKSILKHKSAHDFVLSSTYFVKEIGASIKHRRKREVSKRS